MKFIELIGGVITAVVFAIGVGWLFLRVRFDDDQPKRKVKK